MFSQQAKRMWKFLSIGAVARNQAPVKAMPNAVAGEESVQHQRNRSLDKVFELINGYAKSSCE